MICQSCDSNQDGVDVAADFLVPDPQNSEALRRQHFVSGSIFFSLVIVNSAVDLHDEGDRGTEEVDDEPKEHLLAPEVEAPQAVRAKALPEEIFFGRHGVPQLPRTRELLRLDALVRDQAFRHGTAPYLS